MSLLSLSGNFYISDSGDCSVTVYRYFKAVVVEDKYGAVVVGNANDRTVIDDVLALSVKNCSFFLFGIFGIFIIFVFRCFFAVYLFIGIDSGILCFAEELFGIFDLLFELFGNFFACFKLCEILFAELCKLFFGNSVCLFLCLLCSGFSLCLGVFLELELGRNTLALDELVVIDQRGLERSKVGIDLIVKFNKVFFPDAVLNGFCNRSFLSVVGKHLPPNEEKGGRAPNCKCRT